jgi:hypothetical protein
MDEASAALMGAVIGASATLLADYFREKREIARRAEQIALAAAGEISALMEIVRRRDYIKSIQELERAAAQGEAIKFTVRITHNYFPVLEASVVELGILPDDLPSLIPRFLTFAKSALEDIQAIEGGFWDERPVNQWQSGYGELAQVLEDAMGVGTQILAAVEKLYPRP